MIEFILYYFFIESLLPFTLLYLSYGVNFTTHMSSEIAFDNKRKNMLLNFKGGIYMSDFKFNMNKFVDGAEEASDHSVDKLPDVVEDTKPKRGRPKKQSSSVPAVVETSDKPLSFIQSNEPYSNAYIETNKQLDTAIQQLDALGAEITTNLVNVQNSKTLKGKYNYINDMTVTATSIINAKISAIREKNKTINDINNMELRRLKELKLDESNESDNQKMINLYDAFVNTPVGIGGGITQMAPSIGSMTVNGGVPDMNGNNQTVQSITLQQGNYEELEQQNWVNNLSPAENRMVLEAQGKIETVVFYDNATGNRWYEVVDKVTKQPVPNVEKPDNNSVFDLDINTRGGFAKDSNRNVTYPLIVLNGGDTSMLEY